MRAPFFERLEERARRVGSHLCVGLDPRVDSVEAVVPAMTALVEQTADYVAAFKPNIAFYERFGAAGLDALQAVLRAIPSDIPVIVDAKRGDIGATAEAYADAIFGGLGADAVTVAPYMGRDSVAPFLARADRGVFVLARTSNPGAADFQEQVLAMGGELLYEAVARVALSWGPHVGLVVAGNEPGVLRRLRSRHPHAWFLVPGIGAQGGDAASAVRAGVRADGSGLLVMAARSVAGATDPAAAARDLRDAVNTARDVLSAGGGVAGVAASGEAAAPALRRLLEGLVESGCFRLGSFRLKSGIESPFYIDLRSLVSDPGLLRLAADVYAHLAEDLDYDRLAPIPVAALPLGTATALRLGRPLVYPRIPPKPHGTGNRIEGSYVSGERVLLLDDLVTTGASKAEAVAVLREEGLVVEDLVVLVERGAGARRELSSMGLRLHAAAGIGDLLDVSLRMGRIDETEHGRLLAFASEAPG